MGPKAKQDPESVVKEIKRNTRRKFNSEEKIRIILEDLRGEDSIANICQKRESRDLVKKYSCYLFTGYAAVVV